MAGVHVFLLVLACAALSASLSVATPAHRDSVRRTRSADDGTAVEQAPPPSQATDGVDTGSDETLTVDDLGRKKKIKKTNSTVGQEVISAIVDGLSGESEDAEIGSDIRKEFGFLVDTVTKLGAAAINKYAGGKPGKPSSRTDEAADGAALDGRSTRAVDNVGQGRRRQVRRLLVRYLVLLKVFALGIILPGAVLLSLLQSWKAVTLSLMALLLAGVLGLRGLVSTAAKGQPAEVIHTGPGSHYWRRVSQDQGSDPDRLAYGAYAPVS